MPLVQGYSHSGLQHQESRISDDSGYSGDLVRLLEDISSVSLPWTTLSNYTGAPGIDEAGKLSGRAALSGLGIPTGAEISRLLFFRLLDTLPIPSLVVDRAGRIVHVNQHSASFGPEIIALKGSQFTAVFGEEAAVWKEGVAYRLAEDCRGFAEATLQVEGAQLECRLQYNLVSGEGGPLILVFFRPHSQTSREEFPPGAADIPTQKFFPDCAPFTPGRFIPINGTDDAEETTESGFDLESASARENFRIHSVSTTRGHDYPKSKSMREVMAICQLAAKSDSVVLLLGESGSGKDYLARLIHNLSSRAEAPFRIMNCAAIPAQIAESEIFGHEEGAFTGAHAAKSGILELAHGGSILLNEIGELPLELQAKLLTFSTREVSTASEANPK